MAAVRTPEPLPAAVHEVARTQEWLIDVHQLRRAGVTPSRITRAVKVSRLIRATRGVYDLITTPPTARTEDPDSSRSDVHEHRRRRAAWLGLLAHGPAAVAVGQTALVLHGVQGLPKNPKVEVTRTDRRHRAARPGVDLRRYGSIRYYTVINDRLIAPVEVALAQAIPELGRKHAVAVLDSALHERLLTPAGLHRAHDLARRRRGVEKTHDWWDLADARAESPAETVARLACLDEGVPPDVLQQVFLEPDGSIAARVDMAWWLGDGRWLICEIDGREAHSLPTPLYRDRERQNPLVSAGHLVVRYTGSEAWAGRPGRDIRRVLERAGWRPGRERPSGPVNL